MDAQTDILKHGLAQAALVMMDASALGNLHLGPRRIGRGLAQRISGRLRQVEAIVRRILFLMALRLNYTPAPPREPAPRPESEPLPAPALPEGVELAVFPRLARRRLVLLPPRQDLAVSGPFSEMLQAAARPCGPVSPLKLMARIAALQTVFAAPEAHALRLARSLYRLQAAGEPRPVIGPAAGAFRLPPELGALATLPPAQISAALEMWDNSG